MRVLKGGNIEIDKHNRVKVADFGNSFEVTYLSKENKCNHIKKISGTEYLNDLKPGEVFEFKETIVTRDENYSSVLVSLRKLATYIKANVVEESKCRWITLTYSQRDDIYSEPVPMRDIEKLKNDFQVCMILLRRFFKHNKVEYISVVEPQRSGSWHLHLILIFEHRAPFISSSMFSSKFWVHGFVKIQALGRNCLWISRYFKSYLTDLEYTPDVEINDGDVVKEVQTPEGAKKFIKGARLKYYPAHINIYRCSRGIKLPEIFHCKYMDAPIGNSTLIDKESYILVGSDDAENLEFDKSIDMVRETYFKDNKKAQKILEANARFREKQAKYKKD